jgi:AcrR family transcriptional regulator
MPVRDLASKMGITSASLYKTFDDKRSLHLSALGHNLRIACQIEYLIQRPPQVALEEFSRRSLSVLRSEIQPG